MPSDRQIVRGVLVVIATLAALYALYVIRDVLVLVGVAAFVAVALEPAVDFVQRGKMPRAVAIVIVYLSLIGGVFIVGLLIVPPVVGEVNEFAKVVPRYVQDIRNSDALRKYDDKYDITVKLQSEAEKLPSTLESGAGELESVTVGVFKRVFELITVLVLAFFFLLDGRRWADALARRLGPERELRARSIGSDTSKAVSAYVAGALCIGALAGLVSFAAMEVLGIPFAVPLAVLMAFFALIPLVGSAIGAALITFVALFENFPETAIIWVVFFVLYQQAESHMIGPVVYRRTLALHPMLAIVAVLIGASLLGILGALLAIPAAATIQILINERRAFNERRAATASAAAAAPGAPPATT